MGDTIGSAIWREVVTISGYATRLADEVTDRPTDRPIARLAGRL